ncbi:MAG: GNAT family N-acetyltransferase [Terriglobia bacterium]
MKIVALEAANLDQIPCNFLPERPGSCRACLYWESPRAFLEGAGADGVSDKRGWFAQVLKEFGPCGKLAYEGKELVGWGRYAPAIFFEEAFAYYKYPVVPYPDIPFLACLLVAPHKRGQGIGSALLEAICAELKARRHNGVETVVRRGTADNPSGSLEFYLHRNFFIRRDDPVFPLLRRQL